MHLAGHRQTSSWSAASTGRLDLVQFHVGEEQVCEAEVVSFQPVEADERLVDVAHLVPPALVVRREAGVAAWGGLHVGAQDVPQAVVDGLVVGVVLAGFGPGGDLSPDVFREGGSESLRRSTFWDAAVLEHEVILGLSMAEGVRRLDHFV